MGNISGSLEKILTKLKKKSLEEFKNFFSRQEYKHILKFRMYKNKLIFYVDSPASLYQLNLKKEEIFKKMKEKGLEITGLVFKM